MSLTLDGVDPARQIDPLVFGRRLRHVRRERNLTLQQLAEQIGKHGPYLSLLENGKRQPTLATLQALATALRVSLTDLLAGEPPSHRSWLEVEVARVQEEPLYRSLGLLRLTPTARTPDDTLEHIVRLYGELKQQATVRAATPEEARRNNARLRVAMREANNYFPEIEGVAAQALAAVNYVEGEVISQRHINDLAAHFGFTLHPAQEIPGSVRSLTDLKHHRIYIPQRDQLRTRAARSVVLQTLGHFALGHEEPRSFGDFLRQRVETSYFAGAILVPESAAAAFLSRAKAARDISVEDLKEVFYVSYEMAAHRFTNLATQHLDIPTHFVRSDGEGVIWKAYENDGFPFPADHEGAIEGNLLCRELGARMVFRSPDKFDIHYQWTDTPTGTYWSSSHVEPDEQPYHAITVGTTFEGARYFRGRNVTLRTTSGCPDGPCCRRPEPALAARWDGYAWPSARVRSHVLAALPVGTFPGVDMQDVYAFLESQDDLNER